MSELKIRELQKKDLQNGFLTTLDSLKQTSNIDKKYITNIVQIVPILFIVLSFPVIGVGAYLTKLKKIRPKKEYF